MVENIHVKIGHIGINHDLHVDLNIKGHGVTAIFGPSGSGKTSFLSMFAGITRPNTAQIKVMGVEWQNDTEFYAPHKRPLGYVFQEASLFPHLNVMGNLQYAAKRAHSPVDQYFFDQIVDAMGIRDLLKADVGYLSGGERQRVAIARAMMVRPKILLMDEPLSALDQKRKSEILPYLERLKVTAKLPIIYVTHSMDEIARLADDMIVFEDGHAIAHGSVSQVLSRIDLPNVFGDDASVVLEGALGEADPKWDLRVVNFAGGQIWVSFQDGERVRLRIRARDVSLSLTAHDDSSILNILPVIVEDIAVHKEGCFAMVRCRFGDDVILSRITLRSVEKLKLRKKQKVFAQIKSVAILA